MATGLQPIRSSTDELNGHRLPAGAPRLSYWHRLSVTGEAVDSSDKARGYEVGENEFVFVVDRDLAGPRERPPPGSIPVAEFPHRESPPLLRRGLPRFPKSELPRTANRKKRSPTSRKRPPPARAEASEHAHDRDRALCPVRADRCALFRETPITAFRASRLVRKRSSSSGMR
jgi:hypothetical protein